MMPQRQLSLSNPLLPKFLSLLPRSLKGLVRLVTKARG